METYVQIYLHYVDSMLRSNLTGQSTFTATIQNLVKIHWLDIRVKANRAINVEHNVTESIQNTMIGSGHTDSEYNEYLKIIQIVNRIVI